MLERLKRFYDSATFSLKTFDVCADSCQVMQCSFVLRRCRNSPNFMLQMAAGCNTKKDGIQKSITWGPCFLSLSHKFNKRSWYLWHSLNMTLSPIWRSGPMPRSREDAAVKKKALAGSAEEYMEKHGVSWHTWLVIWPWRPEEVAKNVTILWSIGCKKAKEIEALLNEQILQVGLRQFWLLRCIWCSRAYWAVSSKTGVWAICGAVGFMPCWTNRPDDPYNYVLHSESHPLKKARNMDAS